MLDRKTFWWLFLSAFLFRLGFGLCRDQFWEIDQFQTYLIGLKFYTTHGWPFFGPDVTGIENQAFTSQIPGALEGLLIGLPFFLFPIPEAPFILLNLLSTLGVALLAWYIVKRLPELSYAWLFVWISVLPWSLQESTTVINPAYTFLPAVLFFIGFMESLPWFSLELISPFWANAVMGFSLLWIMQFHFSYIYLVPLALFSLAIQTFRHQRPSSVPYFFLGALPMIALLLPTYLQYGWGRNNVSSGFVSLFDLDNVKALFTILARFLSLVSFEMPRFIGISTRLRIDFLLQRPWLLVPGGALWIVGLLQPLYLLFVWVLELARGRRVIKPKPGPHWKNLVWLLTAVFLMVYGSFWFTIKRPLSHIYFVFFPLLMTFSCYAYMRFKASRWAIRAAKIVIVLGVLFQLGYAMAVAPQDSFYPVRDKIVRAIQEKDYKVLGDRRSGSLY